MKEKKVQTKKVVAKKKTLKKKVTLSDELQNIVEDLDPETTVVTKNYAESGSRIKYFIKKHKDEEIDFEKANPVKHISHETVEVEDVKVLPVKKKTKTKTKTVAKHEDVAENNISDISIPKPTVIEKEKNTWFDFIESDTVNVEDSKNNNSDNDTEMANVLTQNVSYETKDEWHSDDLRGFGLPDFSFSYFKRAKPDARVDKDVFWKKFFFGVVVGCLLFGMSLVIGKYAGKVLNPNVSEAISLQNIDSFVFLNAKNVSPDTPKIFKVTDSEAEIFKNPIFKGVLIGDLVLIYQKLGKIVVFREIENKIISVISL